MHVVTMSTSTETLEGWGWDDDENHLLLSPTARPNALDVMFMAKTPKIGVRRSGTEDDDDDDEEEEVDENGFRGREGTPSCSDDGNGEDGSDADEAGSIQTQDSDTILPPRDFCSRDSIRTGDDGRALQGASAGRGIHPRLHGWDLLRDLLFVQKSLIQRAKTVAGSNIDSKVR